jgi:hypothetical protein
MALSINTFLLDNDLRIATNPCISPDFCLDWPALHSKLQGREPLQIWTASAFQTAEGSWTLHEDTATGDCAWILTGPEHEFSANALTEGVKIDAHSIAFPATWQNLLQLKNLVLETDPEATIFPSVAGNLGHSTLGIGARFTSLHWPAVDWAMAQLGIGLTANQNSIPRELVYDVDEMLADRLDTVPFPFIGTSVPEGHQGQSVEGMSHGAVLTKLKHGFHQRRIAWSFNADHQPIGGKFDTRENALVKGSLLASYITFDLSPELAKNEPAALEDIDTDLQAKVRSRMAAVGVNVSDREFNTLLTTVWPAMLKMKRRDDLYAKARENAFTATAGRAYLRELSIDELPGITTPETTAIMLALCEAMDMAVNFVAPAFGFQKNIPFPDEVRLRELIAAQWQVCEKFGVSIGFHSGSGKSASNYRIMGEMTESNLEIKTSGRYTYEMGKALHASNDPTDQKLWHDWYAFTVKLAILGAFSDDTTERNAAREFITASFDSAPPAEDLFASSEACHAALAQLEPSPDHVLFFEYNFLYVLAAEGRADKAALGDHSRAGYKQRARFYSISDEARLAYSKRVAAYIVFLAETTGLVPTEKANRVSQHLNDLNDYNTFLAEIAAS